MITEVPQQLQTLISALNNYIAGAVGGDKLIAGAITASVLGSLVFALRKIPTIIFHWIDKILFFTYKMEYYAVIGRNSQLQPTLTLFGQKVANAIYEKIKHRQAWATIDIINASLTEMVHPGKFVFMLGKVPVFGSFKMEAAASSESNGGLVKNTIQMKSLKVFRTQIYDFIASLSPNISTRGIYSIAQYNNGNAEVVRYRSLVDCPDIVLDEDLKRDVDDAIDNYLRSREHNNKHHIPHKLTFLFHGPPGNGKSTLGEYIAWKLNSSLFVVQSGTGYDIGCHSIINSYIETIRSNIPINGIPVLMGDDFDTYWDDIGPRTTEVIAEPPLDVRNVTSLSGAISQRNLAVKSRTLGNLLTSLQSSIAINDAVVIFSTNKPLSEIDSALYRPGRITLLREVKKMEPSAIMRLFHDKYGKPWPTDAFCLRWRACDVAAFIEKASGDEEKFISLVTDSNTTVEKIEEFIK